MQIQINFWDLLMAISGLVAAFGTVVWAFGTVLMRQSKVQLDQRFEAIQGDLRERTQQEADLAKQMHQFEKDFLTFQRDMPLLYVRREDYIRGQTTIEAKLDAVYSKLELVLMRGIKNV